MISFRNVDHIVELHRKPLGVLADATFDFDRHRIGLLTEQQEQADALVDLLAGYRRPTIGEVHRFGRVSWPIGRLLQFRAEVSGRNMLRFFTHLYGLDFHRSEIFMHSMIDFGDHYDQLIAGWPRMLNIEFAHCALLLPEFDIYLADGPIILSNEDFMSRWLPPFEERLQGKQLIISCRTPFYLKKFCRSVAVVQDGQLFYFPDVDSAFDAINVKQEEPNAAESADAGEDRDLNLDLD